MEHLTWHPSSYSSDDGNCVEVADLSDVGRAVRDSKDLAGPALTVTPGPTDGVHRRYPPRRVRLIRGTNPA
jgi:hypothetical protein